MRAPNVAFAALSGLLVPLVAGTARAQMTLVDTIDLSASTAEADALEVNRHFGEVYVVDFNGSRGLHVYDLSFNLLRNIAIGSPGYGVPEGVTRDPVSGDFFLPTHSGTVNRYTSTGAFVSSFSVGGAGNGLAFDPADGTLWISHFDSQRVEHRTLDGTLLSAFNPPTLDSLVGLALDPVTGTLFVAANHNDEVHEYTKAGDFIANVLPPGAYPNNGLGIFYDCNTRKLYYGGQSSQLLVYRDASRAACDGGSANEPPRANAGADQRVLAGEPVIFDGSGSSDADGSVAGYLWDFGDGASASGAVASHTYASAGSYVATLLVTDDAGATGQDQLTVTVLSPAQAIGDLRGLVNGHNLPQGLTSSLGAKLSGVEQALNAANASHRQDAANKLNAFINAVQAQRGKALTAAQADALIAFARRIQATL